MSRVTLQDIATQVGVDRSTVSRVLSNKATEGGISGQMSAKILSAARDLKYIPNSSARAMRVGRFNCAALLMSTVEGRSYLPSRLLDGMHDELAALDMHLTVAKVPDKKLSSESYVPKILRSLMADGLLINYTNHLPDHLVEMVQTNSLPAVWTNSSRKYDAVYPANQSAAIDVTRRLIAMGHRDIAYVDLCHGSADVASSHFSAVDRLAGYTHAMLAAGLRPRELRPEKSCLDVHSERAAALQLLSGSNRPTAVVCYFSIFVPSVMWAATQLGLRIPQDLSIVTFAAEDYRETGVSVSSMLETHYALGQQAVRALLRKIEEPARPFESRQLEFIWKDLGTCVSPAAGGSAGVRPV